MNLVADLQWAEVGLGLVIGTMVGVLFLRWREKGRRDALELQRRTLTENAHREAEGILRDAKVAAAEEAGRLRDQTEATLTLRRRELDLREGRCDEREQLLNRQLETLGERERRLCTEQTHLDQVRAGLETSHTELKNLIEQRRAELSRLAQLSEVEARVQLLKEIEEESLKDAAALSRRILHEAKQRAETEAKRLIALAIQRFAGEHAFETSTCTVSLNGDSELKGRIIGREGRNIRAFESATGVTVLIDDTPGAVVLSGFDPVRREIARLAMQRLIEDGRIHPTRIEEVVGKVREEITEAILHHGEEAIFKLGLPPMHEELVKLLGRLNFRYSFSQNILDHSIEVAQLTGMIAAELGENVVLAKRAGLLHDIGKAVDHEMEGAHAVVGAEFARKYGESEEVVNGIASHHNDVAPLGVIGILVSAADAISASRPGARSESMTTYLKRLENLEQIGASFTGVEKCYAVQAGRELRVLVRPDKISDEQAYQLARTVARRVEDELLYPGQIRVTVIRETRCVEYAK